MLVKGYVIIADKVVAFLARTLGRLAVAILQPSQHRLADVYAAIVHDVRLYDPIAVCFQNLCERPAEQVVAHVAEVERFVRVGRRKFDHYERRICRDRLQTVIFCRMYIIERIDPRGRVNT